MDHWVREYLYGRSPSDVRCVAHNQPDDEEDRFRCVYERSSARHCPLPHVDPADFCYRLRGTDLFLCDACYHELDDTIEDTAPALHRAVLDACKNGQRLAPVDA